MSQAFGILKRKKRADDIGQASELEKEIRKSIVVLGIPHNLLAAVISYIPITNKQTGPSGAEGDSISPEGLHEGGHDQEIDTGTGETRQGDGETESPRE